MDRIHDHVGDDEPGPASIRGFGAPVEPPGDPAALRHELRTPLNQILGYAHLLEVELRDLADPRHLEDLRNIQHAARKLLGIAQDLEGAALPQPTIRPGELPAPPGPRRADEGLGDILVVDDNQMNRDILARLLQLHGYHATAAEDGRRALELCAATRFDAVLLDVTMPGMSGLEVLRVLRETTSASDLPVIMATARGASADVVEALRLGANDHVSKPLDLEVVLARLETHLELKRAKQRADRLASELSLRNHFIQKVFGRYLAEDVVARLLEGPEALRLGGEERRMTILMADLRGFTALTEPMPPETVMRVLNGYLGEMARIIVGRGGTIVEFIGDAILALFGATQPSAEDARRAAVCALEMQLAMASVNAANLREGLPELQMGIALNTGAVVVGNIGSEARTKYGVVGSPVNVTARIESLTVGGQILVSEAARHAAGLGLVYGATHSIVAKGLHDRLVVHELRGTGPPDDLRLPEPHPRHHPLPRPLRAEYESLVGKRVEGDATEARVLALSSHGGVLQARPRPALFVNVRLRIHGEEGRVGVDVYAKVVAVDEGTEDTFQVRFTSSPPGLSTLLRQGAPA
jgi:class 3 adenylate cyclase/CheY-like chemotaxis protein